MITASTSQLVSTTDTPSETMRSSHWPAIMAFIRLPLITFGLVVGWLVYRLQGSPNSWANSISITNFTMTIFADGICLALLLWRARVEHFRLDDLIRIDRRHIVKDVLIGLGLALLFLALLQISSILAMLIVYGPNVFSQSAANSTANNFGMPPMWVMWWSLLVLPITVGVMEELVYRGYALPRLETATKSRWLSLLIVSLGFGLQHIVLPLMSWQISLVRFLSILPLGFVFGWIYFKQRRLLPLIIGHWAVDFIGLGLLPLLAVLSR